MEYITTPGKFEGEPAWAPQLWNAVLEGWADIEHKDGSATVLITSGDVELFPVLRGAESVTLWEDEQGFIHTRINWKE